MSSNGSTATLSTDARAGRPRWYSSLFFRVILLCGVLLLCLLGSMTVIARYYFLQLEDDLKSHIASIRDSIEFILQENPDMDLGLVAEEVMATHEGIIDFQPYTGMPGEPTFSIEPTETGGIVRVARTPLLFDGDTTLLVTVRVNEEASVADILRAFKNKYMIAIAIIFVLTLFLMVYFIARALRPLTELSDTCAAISAGELKAVSTRGASGEILALENTFNSMVDSLREKEMVEAKLRQAQRLSALGNLAAGIAHDVRNPLNAIKLLSSHALDSLDDIKSSSAAKPLRTIRNEVNRLEEIVSSFLSLAKESELSTVPSRVDVLLDECVRLFKQNAESRDIVLNAELRAGNTYLMLDQKQWVRAVLNILLNALEACPAGGRVRLFSRMTEDACEIEIRDDGPGLSPEATERIFEPYYTTKPGGTGLGLSITRGIIEEHHGRVEVASTPGQGCQVLISMPLAETQAPEAITVAQESRRESATE